MARRKRHDDTDNLDRWLVSYADFITLLFAFFVVMYAMSSVNEGKYKVLSDTLISAFNNEPKTLQPVQIGDIGITGDPSLIELDDMPSREPLSEMERIEADFLQHLLPFLQDDMVNVTRNELWVEVEINTNFLFESGSARLEPEAVPVLRRVAEVLRKYPNLIRVEGFTDNLPINTIAYPSNWELSAGRAASVVHLFMNTGVEPERMAAIGFGEYQPVESNATQQGRNRNRRVLVVILADGYSRRTLEAERTQPPQLAAKGEE